MRVTKQGISQWMQLVYGLVLMCPLKVKLNLLH